MKNVYLVTINYKGDKNTLELLESLKKINRTNFKLNVVVVDNFSQKPLVISEDKFSDINLKIIYNSKNLGFTGGNNTGIEYSMQNGADYVLILNNDTIVDPGFLEELIKSADADEKTGMVSPKIYFAKGYEFHDKYNKDELGRVIWYAGGKIDWANVIGSHIGVDEVDKGQFEAKVETETATGCCVLIKKKVLEEIKGYDDKYFLYYEDADMCQRVKNKGYRIYYEPKAKIWHKNAQSTGGSGSSLQDYFITRNRLLFGNRYASNRAKFALFRESLILILTGRKWQKKGALDYYMGNFGKGSMDL